MMAEVRQSVPTPDEAPQPAVIPRPESLFKTDDTAKPFEKPTFLPPKPLPVSHSPKISPSSIPNPSPSVSTSKPVDTSYPNYGGYLYSIPGYSAFQPVSYPSAVQPNPVPVQAELPKPDYGHFTPNADNDPGEEEKLVIDDEANPETPKQQDFEDHFTPEIIPAASNTETQNKTQTEAKMSITSLSQGSGATVTIPNQINKDTKKKAERFSLKTSIPISKIDMKCVNNSVDTVFQIASKKPVFNPVLQKESIERPKVEIQSNIVIKTAHKEPEIKETPIQTTQHNSISTLINAAEAISKKDNQFRVPEPKTDVPPEVKQQASSSPQPQPAVTQRPLFNPINLEKSNFPPKPPDGGYNEQKNQTVYIQSKPTNPKIAVPQNPQNPQVLLQKTNFESKNLQAPSRLSNQSKKSKEEIVADNGASSKVVALKRLHQDNCDENDFENLITENQIYGNKIVVKEKSQGTLQEQDLKTKTKDKQTQSESKNVVLQPSYVYVSNVQFPANLMIKNNPKTCPTTESYKTQVSPNENITNELITAIANNNNNIETNTTTKNCKTQNGANKEVQVLKSSNNVLQSLSNNNFNKSDLMITTNQKVIMTPQMTYQVITESDGRNQTTKEIAQPTKLIEIKANEKSMLITCQYKVNTAFQPKLVITNLKPAKVEALSTLDMYVQKKQLRRLKYLSNNNNRDGLKVEPRKISYKVKKNIITPDKMNAEIFKEFAYTRDKSHADRDDSDSDYSDDELSEYNSIIEEYGPSDESDKVEFLAGLRLATHDAYREKDLEKQDRNLKHDSVASAYIAAGILDRLIDERLSVTADPPPPLLPPPPDDFATLKKKLKFLSGLRLMYVSRQGKEAYERTWQEVLKERKRRDVAPSAPRAIEPRSADTLDPSGQLQLLTEIKRFVHSNNDLIKKRLDPGNATISDIRILAEKNFSELNRLSKMADRSVKLLSGQEGRKRDLNPGFDSENIQKIGPETSLEVKPKEDYPKLVIPSIAKVVSLKSAPETEPAASAPASSMDEPAGGARGARSQDRSCQAGDGFPWPGLEAFAKSYREYEIDRKKEMAELHRRNTALCVESAHVTRTASRESSRARALLAERRRLADEERNLRVSIRRLRSAVDVIRNC